MKTYFKDVSTLKEFEDKARKLLEEKDQIISHLVSTKEFQDIVFEVKTLPTRQVYFDEGEQVKTYCPYCKEKTTGKYEVYDRHTCKDVEGGFDDIFFSSRKSYNYIFSPYGYSDVLMVASMTIRKNFDDSLASLAKDDYRYLEDVEMSYNVKLFDHVIGYSDKHDLRMLNSGRRITNNLNILSSGEGSIYRHMYIGDEDSMINTIDPDMLAYIFGRSKEDQKRNIRRDILRSAMMVSNREKSKNNKNAERKKKFVTIDLDYEKMMNSFKTTDFIHAKKISELNDLLVYNIYCNKCKEFSTVDIIANLDNSDKIITCPCGNSHSLYSKSIVKRELTDVATTDVIDGRFTQINFDVHIEVDFDNKEVLLEPRIHQVCIVNDEDKKIDKYVPLNYEYNKIVLLDLDQLSEEDYKFRKTLQKDKISPYRDYFCNTESLKDNILNSNIKYSGLDILYDRYYNSVDNYGQKKELSLSGSDPYIANWLKYPKLERLVKDPVYLRVVDSSRIGLIVNDINDIFDRDNKSKDIFKIRSSVLNVIKDLSNEKEEAGEKREINVNILKFVKLLDDAYRKKGIGLYKDELLKVIKMFVYQANEMSDLDEELDILEAFSDSSLYSYKSLETQVLNIIEIFNEYNIAYGRSVDYLENVYYNQCIFPKEAIQLWKDYLYMIDYLSYEKSKSIVFPSSLKKEHDIASFAFKTIEDEVRQIEFAKKMSYFKDYSYKGDKLSVVVPKQSSEIVREGKSLSHCVASYVLNVSSTRAILFIRHNDDLKKSFYTMEISNNSIVQVRGEYNRVTSREIDVFLEEYALEKNLSISY